jgi:hypothetical protein
MATRSGSKAKSDKAKGKSAKAKPGKGGAAAAVTGKLSAPVIGFGVLVLVCAVVGAGYLVYARNRSKADAQRGLVKVQTAPAGSLQKFMDEPHLMFRSTGLGSTYGAVAVTPVSDMSGPRAFTKMDCERISYANGRGMCLTVNRGAFTSSGLDIFNAKLRQLHHIDLPGIASRTRVAPNGKVGAFTVFVTGDSYASNSFSTRTDFVDLMKGKLIGNLEQFDVTKNGKKVQSIDRNYWGVTFGSDSNTFYATLSTGGKTYLIKGSLRDHSAEVIHDGVECPAVSPDGTRIAYKHREGGEIISGVSQAVRWRLHVLDLQTGKDVELAETRSVDDQPMWFDNKTVGYAIPHAATGTAATDIYRVPADGSGKPTLVVASGWSPTLVP